MTLKQWAQLILVSTSAMALIACSSMHKKTDDAAINDANASYNSQAQASGAGDDSSFSDENGSSGSKQSLSKRVYYFDFDSNVVHDQDKPAIRANATYLASHHRLKVMLEGHTDPRGSREYNIGLGERRAKAVAELLTAEGVNPAQIRIVSYGAQKLASSGRTEADYQRDRRVVLVYLQ